MSKDFRIENGDWKIGANGDFVTVEKTEKLVQDILKICITPMGSNPAAKAYGCKITNLPGLVSDDQTLNTVGSGQLRNSIELLKKLQELQQNYQYVSPEEAIASIVSIQVIQNTTDPRYYSITIVVVNKALQQKAFEFDANFANL